MIHLGDVPASSTLYIPFETYDSNGASVTMTGLAVTDIEIYKNGSVTQRASDAGYTLLDTDGIDFDGLTGIHGFSIDLSDNTDASFYAVGSFYWVVVSSVTVSTQTVNFVAATFRIVAAEGVAGKPKVDVDAFGGTAGTFSGGRPEVNTTHAAGTAWGSGAITAGSIAADAITAAKVAADVSAEIADAVWDEDATGHQTGGTFGQAIGDPGADTTTIYQSVVTDAAGTNVAADIVAIKSDTAATLADTGTDGVVVAAASKTGYALSATGSAALTEGYAADGAAATLPQLLYMILAMLTEASVSGTTLTAKKLDGTTTAATFTLDDGTNPTSITRAT